MPCFEPQSANQFSRRAALQIGTGLFGLSLPSYLKASQLAGSQTKGNDVSCIFIFLAGGISHFESWDPKPDAPEGIRGLWNPISTNVPGTFITEKLPLMAQRMNKVALIRSWQGKTGSHSGGSQHVASGLYPASGKQLFPNFGNLVSALLGTKQSGVAPHVGLPVAVRYTDPPAYLGPSFAAYNIGGDPSSKDFELESLTMPRGRFDLRRNLLGQIDNLGRLAEQNGNLLSAHEGFQEEAFATLTSGAMQKAADLSTEPLELRERYGNNIYGQRVLLARRLIEAGSRFVTINQAVQGGLFGSGKTNGTWDNHGWLFDSMMSFANRPDAVPAGKKWHSCPSPGNLPQLDMSLSTLLDDLDEKGMLDNTLVVVMGEFGRTPKINKTAGRDHYPRAGSVLMAGGGVKGGAVIGATTPDGSLPATRPWTPENFGASIYHALGLPPDSTYYPRQPRPIKISDGEVIEGLFG